MGKGVSFHPLKYQGTIALLLALHFGLKVVLDDDGGGDNFKVYGCFQFLYSVSLIATVVRKLLPSVYLGL